MAETLHMPRGNDIGYAIREGDVTLTEGNALGPEFTDDAAATIVWGNYQKARAYLEENSWLLNWQEVDILFQSPSGDTGGRAGERAPRISRFLVAKNSTTMARQTKRAIFAEQVPFLLRPTSVSSQAHVDAWTALLTKLCKRADFEYNAKLLINCQALQGTGIGKAGWEERTVERKVRKRVKQAPSIPQPLGGNKQVPTKESDEFETVPEKQTESWPFFEYRRLGTTLFDPKWKTPNRPDLSANYAIDIDFVTLADLQEMRQMECYKNIPGDDILKNYFIGNPAADASSASDVATSFTSQSGGVAHAQADQVQSSVNPFDRPLMIIEQWTDNNVHALLCYDGRYLTIRNESHSLGRIPHMTAVWWAIENAGYGIGTGRLTAGDQRINQGVLNEALKMIAYPMNAPIITRRGDNAPTQNTIVGLGRWLSLDIPPGEDVRKAAAYLDTPEIPPDAWRMIAMSQQSGEDLTGANSTFAQGNLGGPGSSAARTATGAGRIASKADENIADPVDAVVEGVIVPFIEFLITMVKERMPLQEIRDILSEKFAAAIIDAIDFEQFLNARFEVDVLAGQRLQAKAGIQQLIPFMLQITQQPQILEYLHQRGETVDFKAMLDLFIQVSELQQQPDIFRPLTDQEKQQIGATNPNAARAAASAQVEQIKGQNQQAAIKAKGEVDLTNKAAEIAMEKAAGAGALERAQGLEERKTDEHLLERGSSNMAL